MKFRVRIPSILLFLPLLISGCIERPTGPGGGPVAGGKTVTITGKVVRSDNQFPVVGAIVTLTKPPLSTTTIDSGKYTLTFDTDSSFSSKLVAFKEGLGPDTVTVFLLPGRSITQNLLLKAAVSAQIIGGLPDQKHFSIKAANRNFSGLNNLNASNTIQVRAGDKNGNAVPAGTAINFSIGGGTIQGVSFTDATGFASASMFGGNPTPVDPVRGVGYTYVKAKAVGENNTIVQDSVLILFSGKTQITGPASGFNLASGGTARFDFSVNDENGNPLAPGTNISVDAVGADVTLVGDIAINLPDTLTRGSGSTRFSFLATAGPVDQNKGVTISISVNSPNGNLKYSFQGTVLAAGIVTGGGGTGPANTIAFVGLSSNTLSISGVGGVETALLTWEVRDSLGVGVDTTHKATVTFSIVGPGGGEYVSPASIVSGAFGRVQTTVNSGTKAGAIQVVAQTIVGSKIIRATPVLINIFGGLPDQAHFTIGSVKLNFPGFDINNLTNDIIVNVGDKFSNPVKLGTAVYFNTTGGIITTSAFTDDKGIARATLISANPKPVDAILGPGFARVNSTTVGEGGVNVTAQTVVLFSGVPSISNLSATSFTVPRGGSSPAITFTVADENGNPLSAGTSINVSLQFTPPPNTTINLSLTGDISVSLGDTQVRGTGTTQFSFRVVDQTAGGAPSGIPLTVVISVTSPNGNAPKVSLNGSVM